MTGARVSEIYGVTNVHISRWKSAGIRAGFPCPLETPEKMPEWWLNMIEAGEFQKPCPTKILVAAGLAGKPRYSISDPDDDEAEEMATVKIRKKVDYENAVSIAEANVAAVERLLAESANDYARTVALQRSHKDSQDTLRALRRDKSRIEKEAGETLLKSEVRAAMLEIHGNIVKRVRQQLKSAYADIPDHSATVEGWGTFVDGLVDSICEGMQKSEFAAD